MNLRLVLILSFGVVAACVVSYFYFDIPAALFFSSSNGPVKDFFAVITYLGDSTVYLVVSAIAAIWYRFVAKRPLFSNVALFVFVAVAASGALNAVFKYVFGRGRPGLLADYGIYGFDFFSSGYDYSSFPSGHANTIAALLTALYLIFPRRAYLYVIAATLPVMSRVVIGAHFLSDVIFGSYLGIVTTILLKQIFAKNGMWLPAEKTPPPSDPGMSSEPASKCPANHPK